MSGRLKFGFLIMLLLVVSKLNAQTIIKGVVTDTSGNPISGASVTSTGNKIVGPIKGFGISGNTGHFELQLDNINSDSLYIKVSCVGYTLIIIVIKNYSQTLNPHLKQDVKELTEVKVKSSSIYVYKDTLNYNVSDFKTDQDRVISDVIKKMPGMEVLSNGQIRYQGKAIQQLTVDGLNLMEGQYGIISNNLNVEAVSKVQVVENDQRIKILDSLVPSNLTTINLKLKKYAVSGVLALGGGFPPFLRSINLTPMMFNNKTQMIHSLMSNNIGEDGSNQLEMLSAGRTLRNSNDFIFNRITGIVAPAVPPFDSKRWLNNNLNQWSSNFLQKLKNDWILKFNVAYINDYRQLKGSSLTTIYAQNQSPIIISEFQNNSLNINRLLGNFVLEKNTRKVFFRNVFSNLSSWNSDAGLLLKNTTNISQINSYSSNYFNNRFTLTTAIGKQLVTFNSFLSNGSLSENLQIAPGPIENVLNNGLPYNKAIQNVKSYGYFSDNNIGIIKKLGRFVIGTNTGFLFTKTTLESNIDTYKYTNEIQRPDSLINNLKLSRAIFYTTINSSYEFGKVFISLEVPFKYLGLRIKDIKGGDLQNLLIQPSLYSEYKINKAIKTYAIINRTDTFTSDVSTLYNFFILTNYRTLQKYSPFFARNTALRGNAGLEYKNALKGLFFSINYEAERSRMNALLNTFILPDGTSSSIGNQHENFQIKHALSINASKLIASINTIVKLSAIGVFYEYERILNGVKIKPHNSGILLQPTIVNNSSKVISGSYKGNFSFRKSYSGVGNYRNLFQHDHHFEANIFITKVQSVRIDYDLYNYNQPGYNAQQFLDILYRFSLLQKKKIEVEFKCTNLFNRQEFFTYYNDGYTTIQNTFLLRIRQVVILLRARF